MCLPVSGIRPAWAQGRLRAGCAPCLARLVEAAESKYENIQQNSMLSADRCYVRLYIHERHTDAWSKAVAFTGLSLEVLRFIDSILNVKESI